MFGKNKEPFVTVTMWTLIGMNMFL